ncbi:uncharacterized protein C16orf74 homolog isoform X1 [Arvicanthis niloticus]|uniref:uncharacterized protein C16orf74 homolog isoform X1 n=1 Tax=Arvicanthis niloticus TaxID=61156 RepID=UPI00402B74EB
MPPEPPNCGDELGALPLRLCTGGGAGHPSPFHRTGDSQRMPKLSRVRGSAAGVGEAGREARPQGLWLSPGRAVGRSGPGGAALQVPGGGRSKRGCRESRPGHDPRGPRLQARRLVSLTATSVRAQRAPGSADTALRTMAKVAKIAKEEPEEAYLRPTASPYGITQDVRFPHRTQVSCLQPGA